LVVTAGCWGDTRYLVDRGLACSTSYSAQDSPHNRLYGSNVSNAKFKKPSFIGKLIGLFEFFLFLIPHPEILSL